MVWKIPSEDPIVRIYPPWSGCIPSRSQDHEGHTATWHSKMRRRCLVPSNFVSIIMYCMNLQMSSIWPALIQPSPSLGRTMLNLPFYCLVTLYAVKNLKSWRRRLAKISGSFIHMLSSFNLLWSTPSLIIPSVWLESYDPIATSSSWSMSLLNSSTAWLRI